MRATADVTRRIAGWALVVSIGAVVGGIAFLHRPTLGLELWAGIAALAACARLIAGFRTKKASEMRMTRTWALVSLVLTGGFLGLDQLPVGVGLSLVIWAGTGIAAFIGWLAFYSPSAAFASVLFAVLGTVAVVLGGLYFLGIEAPVYVVLGAGAAEEGFVAYAAIQIRATLNERARP